MQRRLLARASLLAAAAFAAAAASALAGRLAAPRPAPGGDGPSVTAVLPARNEVRDVERTVADLAAQTHALAEIVAVDDGSWDGTRAALARAARAEPRVRVVDGTPPPPGWLGKPWALHQGVRGSDAAWLLFVDADVRLAREAVATALAFAAARGDGGCTLAPRLETAGFWERTVQPCAALTIAAVVAPPVLAQRRDSPVALAAGGFLLIERGLYERCGGHAGVRDRVADDLALAGAVKRAGGFLALANGGDLVRVRMYHGHAELLRGWRKNAAYGLPGGVPVTVAAALLLLVAALAPPASVALGWRRGDRRLLASGGLALAALGVLRAASFAFAPTPRRYVATTPLGLAWLAGVALLGAVDRATGGSRWRGRRYPNAR